MLEGIVVPVPFPAVGMVVLCLPSSGLALFVVVALLIIRVGKCECSDAGWHIGKLSQSGDDIVTCVGGVVDMRVHRCAICVVWW